MLITSIKLGEENKKPCKSIKRFVSIEKSQIETYRRRIKKLFKVSYVDFNYEINSKNTQHK
jgi:hypothetical protein